MSPTTTSLFYFAALASQAVAHATAPRFDSPTLYFFDRISIEVANLNGDKADDIIALTRESDTLHIYHSTENDLHQLAQTIPTGFDSRSLHASDINNDSYLDAVVIGNPSDTTEPGAIHIYLGDAQGLFNAQPIAIAALPDPILADVGDMDRDGNADIVLTHHSSSAVAIHYGDGQGGFSQPEVIDLPEHGDAAYITDLDHDMVPDMLATDRHGGVYALIQGTDSYEVIELPGIDAGFYAALAHDFDGDMLPEIITYSSDRILVHTNLGKLSFSTPTLLDCFGVRQVVVTDLDGDGNADLLASTQASVGSFTTAFYGTGDGSFEDEHEIVTRENSFTSPANLNDDEYTDYISAYNYIAPSRSTITLTLGNGVRSHAGIPQVPTFGSLNRITLADFNGDGIEDLAGVSTSSTSLRTFIGTPTGFEPNTQGYDLGRNPDLLTTADLNGDGLDDVVAGSRGDFAENSQITIWLASADGSLTLTDQFESVDPFTGVDIADFTGDGINDLIVSTLSLSNSVQIMAGRGDGTFEPLVQLHGDVFPYDLLADDFNEDGRTDFVTATHPFRRLNVFLADSNGHFHTYTTNEIDTPFLSGPRYLVSSDWNGDGFIDLAVAADVDSPLFILLNQSDGTFSLTHETDPVPSCDSFHAYDLNADGHDDLLLTYFDFEETRFTVLDGLGDGTFDSPRSYLARGGASDAVAVDKDQDGILDIVTANPRSSTLSMHLNAQSADSACPADLNNDGSLNFFDLSAFLTAFIGDDPIADFDQDGRLTFFDLSAFLIAFNAGCP